MLETSNLDFTSATAIDDNALPGEDLTYVLKSIPSTGVIKKGAVEMSVDGECGEDDCSFAATQAQCNNWTGSFTYQAKNAANDLSERRNVSITITFTCTPEAVDFTTVISNGTGAINFTAHTTSNSDEVLTIKIPMSLPASGTLTVTSTGAAAETETAYALDALTYTANPSLCTNGGNDSFYYKPYNTSGETTDSKTATINFNAFTCAPTAEVFDVDDIEQTKEVVFTSHVEDATDDNADVKVKIQALPTKGTLTVTDGDGAVATGTKYGQTDLTYTSSDAQCAADYSDSFTYKAINAGDVESPEYTVTLNAKAFTCPPVTSTSSTSSTTSSTTTLSSSSDSFETWKIIVIVVAGLAAIGIA